MNFHSVVCSSGVVPSINIISAYSSYISIFDVRKE